MAYAPGRFPSMGRLLPLAGLFSLGLMLGGCGTQTLDHGRGGAFTSLGFDEATLQKDGTPHYLAGRLPTDGKGVESVVATLTATLGSSYRLAPGTTFTLLNQQSDGDGRSFYRLQQRHGGLRVVGRQVAIQTGSDGSIETILGQLAPEVKVDLSPTLDGTTALSTALGTLAYGAGRVATAPELAIYVDDAGEHLVYAALVDYPGATGRAVEELFASATDGHVVARLDRTYRAGLSRQIYTLTGGCIHDGSELPGMSTLNEGGTTTDAPSKRAYDNSGNVYWYYYHMFNRHSYDDADHSLVSTVMVTFDTGMGGCDGGNAAWIPDPFNEMVYGNGSLGGILLKEMTLGFDVAAHEMSHAVTYATSNLDYQNESGALNEANSDIMGATAEAWVNSGGGKGGSPASITVTDKTWKIGEDVAGLLIPGGALRFMNNPTADKVSKDFYAERYTGTDDNGGVHLNSGIANLAFYLLTAGGAHPRAKTPVTVSALGINKAAHIFEVANTKLYTSTTDFQGARYATARAAELLYGRCSDEWANVHRAWDAVGVLGNWTPCVTPPGGF